MIFGKYINRYYLKNAPVLLLGLLALLMVDYIQLLIPQFYRLVINGVNLGQVVVNGQTLPFTKEVLLQYICLPMIWIVVLMVIGRFLWRICFFGSAVRVAANLRERMFDHSRQLSQQYYQVNKVGNLMSLYTNDLDTIQECFGDGVLMFTPTYAPFHVAAARQGRRSVFCRLLRGADGRFCIDFDALERLAAAPENRLLLLCSPHNPTGRVWTEQELRRVGEICLANGVFIVSDEIHADLTRVGVTHIPLQKLFADEARVITCTAPSKTFNMAGNQLANIFIPDGALRARWRSAGGCGEPTPLAIDAVIAAYDECEDWLEQLRAYLDGNFRLAERTLGARLPLARYAAPEGTYLMWLDASFAGETEAGLRARVEAAGLCVEYASDFVDNGDGHMRVNIACPRSVLQEALERLGRALS